VPLKTPEQVLKEKQILSERFYLVDKSSALGTIVREYNDLPEEEQRYISEYVSELWGRFNYIRGRRK
jgi:hypothetical protein